MFAHIRAAVVIFVLLSLVTGIGYPLVVTGIGQRCFRAGQGSFIQSEGVVRGSELIGQPFDGPQYLWGRLSATGPFPYNSAPRAGRTWGQPIRRSSTPSRRTSMPLRGRPCNQAKFPVDLVTASGSGLDPHFSPPRPSTRSRALPRHAALRSKNCVRSSPNTHSDAPLASWVSHASMCCW